MTDFAIVIAIVAIAIAYAVYRIFFVRSCGCNCGGQKGKKSSSCNCCSPENKDQY